MPSLEPTTLEILQNEITELKNRLEELKIEDADLKNRLEEVETTIKILSSDIKREVIQNGHQNRQIKELLKNNRRSVKSLTYILGSGILVIFVMMFRLDLKTEAGVQAYTDTQARIFDFITLIVAGSGGALAIREERKSKPEEELEDI